MIGHDQQRSPIVFLSYARPDRDCVARYFDELQGKGFNVWMDHIRLKPGQNWDFEIQRALDTAAIIVVFLSKNSTDRRGYLQRELNHYRLTPVGS